MNKKDVFMYFAYGSNLLAKRIHIQNPSAVRKGIGKLKRRGYYISPEVARKFDNIINLHTVHPRRTEKRLTRTVKIYKVINVSEFCAIRFSMSAAKDYRLGFFGFSTRWGGASATIIPHKGHCTWGAVWEIHADNMADLDNQEGVAESIYYPKMVDVELSDGEIVNCRVYQRVIDPKLIENHEIFPDDKPSLLYRETIVQGAIESGLPEDYMELLNNIQHNGYKGQAEMGDKLNIL